MRSGSLMGLGVVLRAGLRRDRWFIPLWVAGVVAFLASTASGVQQTYTSPQAYRQAAAVMQDNPSLIAMTGPARALDTYGGQVAWQGVAFGAVVVGLMAMFIVVRHTRAEEDSGRDELLRSAAVGRMVPLVAALVLAFGAVAASALLGFVTLVGLDLPAAGSAVMSVGLLGYGVVVAVVAGLAAQVAGTARAARGLAGIFIAATYLLRAVGDVSAGWLSWLSPMGWAQAMWPYSGDRWWPALLFVATAVVVAVAAVAVFARRDLDAGLLAQRPGPAQGRLTGWTLPLRLALGSVIGWGLGLFAVGLSYGLLGDSIGDLIGDNPDIAEMVAGTSGDLVTGFHATALGLMAVFAGGFAISIATRLASDEDGGHAELLLATPWSRARWWSAYALTILLGTSVVVLAGGLGLGLGFAAVTGDVAAVARLSWQSLAQLPGPLALAGFALLAHGVARRWVVVGWLGLAYAAVILNLGALLDLPGWVQGVSPFDHLASVPAQPFDVGSFAAVAAVAAALGAAGWLGLRRRDIG